MKDQQLCISAFVAYLIIPIATRGTSPDMTTVFHARMCGRFIEILSNLGRKKLHRTNQGSFNNIDNVSPNLNPPSNLQEKVNPRILKGDFSSRTDCFIFTSIAQCY